MRASTVCSHQRSRAPASWRVSPRWGPDSLELFWPSRFSPKMPSRLTISFNLRPLRACAFECHHSFSLHPKVLKHPCWHFPRGAPTCLTFFHRPSSATFSVGLLATDYFFILKHLRFLRHARVSLCSQHPLPNGRSCTAW
jgi:hypothetical protein